MTLLFFNSERTLPYSRGNHTAAEIQSLLAFFSSYEAVVKPASPYTAYHVCLHNSRLCLKGLPKTLEQQFERSRYPLRRRQSWSKRPVSGCEEDRRKDDTSKINSSAH